MPRPYTREGIETRFAIRTALDENPAIPHAEVRRQFSVAQAMIDSALGKTSVEWQALLDATPASKIRPEKKVRDVSPNRESTASPTVVPASMPGLEQGIVKFTRKPAKMGEDFIFWIPRVYLKNGLVDPSAEYEIYLKKKQD